MNFSSKILLFGEYTVLHGSDGLLIPFAKYSGSFAIMKDDEDNDSTKIGSNKTLQRLLDHLQHIFSSKSFDLERFRNEIANGLYFSSSIPIGYGAGSSGALTAAIYRRYFKNQNLSINDLRKNLAAIESFFHGSSSGLDPLVSYLNTALHVRGNEVNRVSLNPSPFNMFIIDSGISRSTGELVKIFNHKCQDPGYLKLFTNEIKPINNQAIKHFIEGDTEIFFKKLKILSGLQLYHFNEMILPQYQTLWKTGLESNDFYLKLCGAGGGGYYLGFAKTAEVIENLGQTHGLRIERV